MGNRDSIRDVVVIGGGPSGSTAALYAARYGLNVLEIEQGMPGGQISSTDIVDNYPGVLSISGSELGARMSQQAEESGAELVYGDVSAIVPISDGFLLNTSKGDIKTKTVIVSTGAAPRMAGFAGEEEFRGRGVSYCATCDAMFFRNKDVFVVGGGNSAVEEALYLARVVSSVTLVVRKGYLRASKNLVEKLLALDNVTILFDTKVARVSAESSLLDTIELQSTITGAVEIRRFEPGAFGVFVFVGADARCELVKDFVEIASDGSAVTDENMATDTPGLFCAGDMRRKSLRQVVTAAADGAIAARSAFDFIEGIAE